MRITTQTSLPWKPYYIFLNITYQKKERKKEITSDWSLKVAQKY